MFRKLRLSVGADSRLIFRLFSALRAHRAQALADLRRAYNPAGFGRQIAAMIAAGDRRARLNAVVAPTLVIHGVDDLVIPMAGGRDTAANIKGAKLLAIEGMGHDLPAELYDTVVHGIVANARRTRS